MECGENIMKNNLLFTVRKCLCIIHPASKLQPDIAEDNVNDYILLQIRVVLIPSLQRNVPVIKYTVPRIATTEVILRATFTWNNLRHIYASMLMCIHSTLNLNLNLWLGCKSLHLLFLVLCVIWALQCLKDPCTTASVFPGQKKQKQAKHAKHVILFNIKKTNGLESRAAWVIYKHLNLAKDVTRCAYESEILSPFGIIWPTFHW